MTNVLSSALTALVTVTTRIVSFIGGHEGFVSKAYLDPAGVLTIGYGFTMRSRVFAEWWRSKYGRGLKRGDTMTKAEAHQVLLALLAEEYAPPVDAKLGRLAQRIREASLSAVYNLGAGSLRWKWAAALVRGDLEEAGRLWRSTGTTAGKKRLPGLVRRRNEEADIAQYDRWPAWVKADSAPPETHVDAIDIKQAQLWLNALGYDCGAADGVPGLRTVNATRRFQTDHGSLKVDGIIGPATLSALQRAMDLKAKGGKVVVGGGAATGGGLVENGTDAGTAVPDPAGGDFGWLGDALIWGGIAVLVIGLGYLAWRYRDELVVALKKL